MALTSFDLTLISASWRGRLVRSLPPEINVMKSCWISILGLHAPAGEPEINKVRINRIGQIVGVRVISRAGQLKCDWPIISLPEFIHQVKRMWINQEFTPMEMQECYNAIRHWLRHDERPRPDKEKGLIPGFVYTGPSQSK